MDDMEKSLLNLTISDLVSFRDLAREKIREVSDEIEFAYGNPSFSCWQHGFPKEVEMKIQELEDRKKGFQRAELAFMEEISRRWNEVSSKAL